MGMTGALCLVLSLALTGAGCGGAGTKARGPGGTGGDEEGGGSGSGGLGGGGGAHADAGTNEDVDASAGSGGAGGVGARDASAPDRADVRTSTPETGSPGDGGRPSNPALDQRCTVPVRPDNKVPTSAGGMTFAKSIPDPTATMQRIARAICNTIYRKPEEVKDVMLEGLTIDAVDGVAYTAGNAITFSSNYIASFANGKSQAAIDFELNGVLAHEGTHIWQYNHGGGWLVEAMADYVRYRVGYDKLSRRSRGGNWDSPYTTGGFFIVWIEDKYDPDFGYKVNMGMKDAAFSYPALVKQVTGKDVDALWAEYQSQI
jgi:hypothetical protein